MTSVHELEADVAATRERLHETIGRIQDKLTVSGMVDEIMGQAGVPALETGHGFVLGLLRRHPLPLMVAAAGIGFLIYRMGQGRVDHGPAFNGDGEIPSADVPILIDGRARVYDPDTGTRPSPTSTGPRRVEA